MRSPPFEFLHSSFSCFQILNEASTFLNSITLKVDDSNNQNINVNNNLWTPKKVSSIPYKKSDEGECFRTYRRLLKRCYCGHLNNLCFLIVFFNLFRSLRIVSSP